MHERELPTKGPGATEEEVTDLDMQAVEAGLVEIERGEVITLAELRQELEER